MNIILYKAFKDFSATRYIFSLNFYNKYLTKKRSLTVANDISFCLTKDTNNLTNIMTAVQEK
jgi:hypothetical protein